MYTTSILSNPIWAVAAFTIVLGPLAYLLINTLIVRIERKISKPSTKKSILHRIDLYDVCGVMVQIEDRRWSGRIAHLAAWDGDRWRSAPSHLLKDPAALVDWISGFRNIH